MGRLCVLDFDGTMTDAEVEGAPFTEGYLEDLAALSGLGLDEVRALHARFSAEVAARPTAHGWMYDGRIVAPAVVDPYLRIMPVARRILDEAQVFLDERDRSRLLDGVLYKYNYKKTVTAFREGARAALEALEGRDVFVVTNSHTEPVQQKIEDLGRSGDGTCSLAWLVPRVHGRAKKYVLDPTFDAVPEALEVPGLDRPVLLRRRHYHDRLEELLGGRPWSDLLVVGDIFELDLALPLALGAEVALVVNEHTPEYEVGFVEASPRARIVRSLAEVPALAGA